jgi:hypothetical protein
MGRGSLFSARPINSLLTLLTQSFLVWCGSEEPISRILCLPHLAIKQVAIICLGCQLPDTSSDQPEGSQASNLLATTDAAAIPSIWSCSEWGLPSQLVT